MLQALPTCTSYLKFNLHVRRSSNMLRLLQGFSLPSFGSCSFCRALEICKALWWILTLLSAWLLTMQHSSGRPE